MKPLEPWVEPRPLYNRVVYTIPEKGRVIRIETGFDPEAEVNRKPPLDFSDRVTCWEWTEKERVTTASAPEANSVEELAKHVSLFTRCL